MYEVMDRQYPLSILASVHTLQDVKLILDKYLLLDYLYGAALLN